MTTAVPPAPAAGPDGWRADDGAWTLRLAADVNPAALATDPLPPPGGAARVRIDARALTDWDTGTAAALWALRGRLQQQGHAVEWAGLPDGLDEVLRLARTSDEPPATSGAAPVSTLAASLTEARRTVTFFGEVLIATTAALAGRAPVRAADVLHQMDQTGPRAAPIVLLSCALVGVMLAYMGGAQLERIGAQGFLAGVVTVGMVRELAGLMAGVILAGRVGAAFAAQLATMRAGEEIDALRALGIDPMTDLVLPRLLALMLMAPAMLAFGALAGIAAGALPAVAVYGVGAAEYVQQSLQAMTATHLWIGLFKGMLYAALVAVAGCREGLHAGRSAEAVGRAVTAAVVKSLVWIVTAACATTVAFTAMGY